MKIYEAVFWITTMVIAVTIAFLVDAFLSFKGEDKVSLAKKR